MKMSGRTVGKEEGSSRGLGAKIRQLPGTQKRSAGKRPFIKDEESEECESENSSRGEGEMHVT